MPSSPSSWTGFAPRKRHSASSIPTPASAAMTCQRDGRASGRYAGRMAGAGVRMTNAPVLDERPGRRLEPNFGEPNRSGGLASLLLGVPVDPLRGIVGDAGRHLGNLDAAVQQKLNFCIEQVALRRDHILHGASTHDGIHAVNVALNGILGIAQPF